MLKRIKQIGPGILVTAAFIGPGSVTLCTMAGATFGYALLWALLFSVVATIILQEMTARLGITARLGLGESIRHTIATKSIQVSMMLLIFSAIIIGNGAYEGGNLAGAAAGLGAVSGDTIPVWSWTMILGILTFVFLWFGKNKWLIPLLLVLVMLMSLVFVITAILSRPSISEILAGFWPSMPTGSVVTVVGLIGTTIVPYNLFLHAAAVRERASYYTLEVAKLDLWIAIPLGGLISLSIVISAAATFYSESIMPDSVLSLGTQLEPVFGSFAKPFLGLGFFAAGLSSAVTAPLAAAYAAREIFEWRQDSIWFKMVWMLILFIGVLFSVSGIKPIQIIVFAQVANGILLPVVVAYLIWAMNQNIPGLVRNNGRQNVLGIVVFIIAMILSFKSLWAVWQ